MLNRDAGGQQEHQVHAEEDRDVAQGDNLVVRLPELLVCDDVRDLGPVLLGHPGLPHGQDGHGEDGDSDEVDQERGPPGDLGQGTSGELEDEHADTHGGGLVAEHLDPLDAAVVLGDEGGDCAGDSGDSDTQNEPGDEDRLEVLQEIARDSRYDEDREGEEQDLDLPEPVGREAHGVADDCDGQRGQCDDQRNEEVIPGEGQLDLVQGGRHSGASHQDKHGAEEDGDQCQPGRLENTFVSLHGTPSPWSRI